MRVKFSCLIILLTIFPVATFGQQETRPSPNLANWIDGYVSVLFNVMPDIDKAGGHQTVAELRTSILIEHRQDISHWLHLNMGAYIDSFVANRNVVGNATATAAAIIRPSDLYAEFRTARADVRVGASRIVWGRLDEFQPSDVVNPLDISRFFLEGRSEARLPVMLVRGRVYLPRNFTVEGIVVPMFRPGRFDQLEEETSPFFLGAPKETICLAGTGSCTHFNTIREEPKTAWNQLQGGGRVTGTVGRIDLSASVYRGFKTLPIFTLKPLPAFEATGQTFLLYETFPRFTMIAGDFETVRGQWGIRGEVAYFPEDTLQSFTVLNSIPGRSLSGGVGIDRRVGDYHFSSNLMIAWSRINQSQWKRTPVPFDPTIETTDVLFVSSIERTFARETRTLRFLSAYNPKAESAFVRGVGSIRVRDNVWLEISGGWLLGNGLDMLSRFSQRDFLYGRLKFYF